MRFITLLAFIALTTYANAQVTKARYGSLRPNDTVVVDVQIEGVDTNAVRDIAKEEVDKTTADLESRVGDVEESNRNAVAVVAECVAFVDGSNVIISVTNYMSGSYRLDAAKFRLLELREGEYRELYNSKTEILLHVTNETSRIKGEIDSSLNALSDDVDLRISSKADKDWGKYTSAGNEAPSNTTYLTSPNTVFAGGMEYERVSVSLGTICVLKNAGAPVYTQGDEGTFKFQDDGGTNYFGFAKSDSYTIGCNTDDISVHNDIVTLTYNVTMSGVPCIWYTPDLINQPWVQLNLPDGSQAEGAPVVVSWETNPEPGQEICYINAGNIGRGFFKATIEVAGSAKFMTNMPADFTGGIFCTDGRTVVRPVNNNGVVTLEVVRTINE
jgi:hypothetical protein